MMISSPSLISDWFLGVMHMPTNRTTALLPVRPDQCKLNSLQSCAIDVMHDVNKHLALIYCIEFLAIEGRQKEWETCFSSLGLPKKDILDSYNSSNATKLEQNYGNEIMHLNPPLEFVPWLVLNNQPIGNDYENFAGYVCKAYKCKIVPMACQSVHLKQKTELTHSTQAINQPESSLSPGPLIQPKSTFYQQIRLHNSTNCGS